ncbi:BMP family ABC transporter substrate-binding protein [Caloramator sp. ALD01]|uniref:BMP family ABC transporter substrate-binding protein n=1 Tax=Caloramator sp. ALD01 TaxID=1031288 RepID=UPI0004232AB2|nr:BMP family ABC transporter substrate-binding protein [Caloramator sp. ALD01]
MKNNVLNEAREHYSAARRLAIKEYNKYASKGESGYLPSLEGVIKNTDIVSEVNLGIVEIPLKKVVGTYSHLRSLSFARNFMPLLNENTEMQTKWVNLCAAHLEEGIRDPIKVYEYLNWFYVVEGNKRVSVLKYFDAYSIPADVTRIIPKYDENNHDIKIYYEFLNFNKITGLNSIYFSKKNRFNRLLKAIDSLNIESEAFKENRYKYFERYIYIPFREIYISLGGKNIPITTGDALFEYFKLYGLPFIDTSKEEVTQRIRLLIPELKSLSNVDYANIQTSPLEVKENLIQTLSTFVIPKKKLKVLFAYAGTIESSGWTYAHELGRQHIEEVLKEQVSTEYVENVPFGEGAYNVFKDLAEVGYDVIFTTSPIYHKETLKCALEYPDIKFFNCSEFSPYTQVNNYFGRTYEPRFLTGLIAGALTKNNKIGYVATSPSHEVISSINAFSLGAKLVNPYASVYVSWTGDWNKGDKSIDADKKLIELGVDIISNMTIDVNHPVTKMFGVYSMLTSINSETQKPEKYYAAPIWRWGIFYEKILKSVLNEQVKNITDIFTGTNKSYNFWWGIDAGVLDIYYSKNDVPEETQKLVEFMKRMIADGLYNPFTGPIYDNTGMLRIEKGDTATYEQILSMKWYVDNVVLLET